VRTSSSNADTYWATLGEDDLRPHLLSRLEIAKANSLTSTLFERYARAFRFYLGFDPAGVHATSQVLRGGEQGELALIKVNHSRPLLNTLLNLIAAPKIVWQPKAVNVDYESIRECKLAAAVLEYFWTHAQVSQFSVAALELALAFGDGFIFAPWDPDAGDDAGVELPPPSPPSVVPALPPGPAPQYPSSSIPDPVEPPSPPPSDPGDAPPDEIDFASARVTKTGSVAFHVIAPWDVIRDSRKTSYDALDWVIIRQHVNKYDLAAKHPDHADEILKCPGEPQVQFQGASTSGTDSDDVTLFWFYHRRSAAVPNGREGIFLSDGTVLSLRDLPYHDIPLYRVAAGEQLSTPFGYHAVLRHPRRAGGDGLAALDHHHQPDHLRYAEHRHGGGLGVPDRRDRGRDAGLLLPARWPTAGADEPPGHAAGSLLVRGLAPEAARTRDRPELASSVASPSSPTSPAPRSHSSSPRRSSSHPSSRPTTCGWCRTSAPECWTRSSVSPPRR
jgi:hypothetical protein